MTVQTSHTRREIPHADIYVTGDPTDSYTIKSHIRSLPFKLAGKPIEAATYRPNYHFKKTRRPPPVGGLPRGTLRPHDTSTTIKPENPE